MAPKKRLVEQRARLAALLKQHEALIDQYNNDLAKADDLTTQFADSLRTSLDQSLKQWGCGKVDRKYMESVFVTFTCYPTSLCSLIRRGNWQQNQSVLMAIDSLDLIHTRAGEILASWACRLNLKGGLIEVSGEHCRKVLIADPSAWLDTKDGRWPYCLDNKPGSISTTDYQQIMEAEVVLRQLHQQLLLCVEDDSAVVTKLFTGEDNHSGSEVQQKKPVGKATVTKPATEEKKQMRTKPMTKIQIAGWFNCNRNDVEKNVLSIYWHESVGRKYRMLTSDMPEQYHIDRMARSKPVQ